MDNIRIDFLNCGDERYDIVKQIRTSVFTKEQKADASEEFDCYDSTSLFALLYEGDKAVATARIAKTPIGVKIGRIAVGKVYRGNGYGAMIVDAVVEKALEAGASDVYVDAQNYAVPFYEKLGFYVIGDEITDRGLPHIPMKISKGDFYGGREK